MGLIAVIIGAERCSDVRGKEPEKDFNDVMLVMMEADKIFGWNFAKL